MERPTKITFAEMREMSVRGLLIYCADYRCSHSIAISGEPGPMMPSCPISRSGSPVGFCGKRGADVRPDFNGARRRHR
jgi:hypothetical protein